MRKPSWIRSHHTKPDSGWGVIPPRRVQEINDSARMCVPDLARFPDLPTSGYETDSLRELREVRDRLKVSPR